MYKKLLYKVSSQFATYRVIEMMYQLRPSRVLFGDDSSPQSGIALDDDSTMLFDYNQRFMEIAASIQPKSVLVVGGGAFTLPTALLERFGDIAVDAVEIDPILPKLAQRFFNLRKSPNLNIVIQDGRDYIAKNQKKYDLVVIDAFNGMEIPRQLLSVEAAKLYHDALRPGGVLAINFISAYHTIIPTLAHKLIATFEEDFTDVEVFPSEYGGRLILPDNLVLVASRGKMPNLDYLQTQKLSPPVGVKAAVIRDK